MPNKKRISHEALMRYARLLGYGEIHHKIDKASGLNAIIAINNTQRGPAIGGCRFYSYQSKDQALKDVLRLGYMMTLKAAVSELPHGGAKSVIITPPEPYDRKALFSAFGDFVHSMNGRYITAVDVGSTESDMNVIGSRTPYVLGRTDLSTSEGDPSPYTALGIFRGMQAAIKYKLGRDDVEGIHIALQGAGRVAYFLAKLLTKHGAIVTTADPNKQATERMADELGANIVSHETIYDVDCDVFGPCALGGTVNLNSIHRIKSKIIAGAANNQLANLKFGQILHDRGILYAPDFVINAGGLIYVSSIYNHLSAAVVDEQINHIYDTSLKIFERSERENKPTMKVAEEIALENLKVQHDAYI